MDVSEDPDDFVYYGSSLDPLEEGQLFVILISGFFSS